MASGEFAVKINDIITEVFSITKNNKPIVGPGAGQTWSKIGRGLKFGASIIKPPASIPPSQQVAQNQAQQDAVEPEPADGSVSTPLAQGVTVQISNPLTLTYKKTDYLLNKQDVWVQLGPQPKAATAEMQQFLNSQLEKL